MDTADDIDNLSKMKPSIDFKSEDLQCKTISQKNLKEIHDKCNSVVDLLCNIKSDENLITEGANVIDHFNNDERVVQGKQTHLVALKDEFAKKKQSVAHLEIQVKNLKHKLQKLKEANIIDEMKHQSSLELFQKSLQNYKLYYGYDMKIEDKSGKTKYTIVINFNLEDGTLSHPIKFIFDKKDDSLLDFDASDLITNKQKKLLFNNFQVAKNYLALFYALRSCAVKTK